MIFIAGNLPYVSEIAPLLIVVKLTEYDYVGATAIATALIVPGDQALVERIREGAENFGGEFGISAWNGFAMARFCAQDAARLRAGMVAVLSRAGGSPLPRLWLS